MDKQEKYFFVGDVHGCLEELKALLSLAGWTKNTTKFRVILLGDLVDRGPDSKGVIGFAMKNNLEVVRGNHDDRYVGLKNKMLDYQPGQGGKMPKWMRKNPERLEFLRSLSMEEIEFLEATPTIIEFEDLNLVAVHAGFKPGIPISEQEENTKMHIRFLYDKNLPAYLDKENDYSQPKDSFFWAEKFEEPVNVVYGHHVWDLKDIKTHQTKSGHMCYGIDTGACFGGRLSGLMFFSDGSTELLQVDSKKKNKNSKNR